MIKKKSLIVKKRKLSNGFEFIIKKDNPSSHNGITKLGDVFSELPNGLVYKEETGMGATHLELTTKRNSIIVQPLKVTAASKAVKHKSLYVGSETNLFPKRISANDIKRYASNPKIEYKKIIVVADSLYKVITGIGESVFTDFFILIDEIDSFQMDSSFRSSMEKCIDYYKAFPVKSRAMVTATPLAFSDPILKDEPVINIKYDIPLRRNITVSYSSDLQGAAVVKTLDLLKKFPNDKILIAFNSVSGCYDIAHHLSNEHKIEKNDIKILCSSSNKKSVRGYYTELEESKLPGKINFITSAYFTGFDLDEDFHLISISGSNSAIQSLSEKRLKQIAGRCRETLLSETIIYNTISNNKPIKTYTIEELIETGNKEISALLCIKRNYEANALLKRNLDVIRDLILSNTQTEGYQFVRKSNKDEPILSYFNIDAFHENMSVRNRLYQKEETLPNTLKAEGHIVDVKDIYSNVIVEFNDIAKINRQADILEIIEVLRNLPIDEDPNDSARIDLKKLSMLQKDIVNQFSQLYKYIDNKQLLQHIEKKAGERDSRGLNNLMFAAFYVTLPHTENYKRIVSQHIPLKSAFTKEELLKKWINIFVLSGLQVKVTSETHAVRITKLHFKTKRKKAEKAHLIVSENPLNFKILGIRPTLEKLTLGPLLIL